MRGRGSGRTILCVDDHEIGLKVRKRVLEMAGYTVLIATRVHEALALFRTHDVDLVLTEHVAPATVDGPTLPAAMKMLKSDVPVAILSADVHASSEDRRFADVFITKLIPADELLQTIRRLLSKRSLSRLPLAA